MPRHTPSSYAAYKGWSTVDHGDEIWLNCPSCGEGEQDGSFSMESTSGTWNCKRASCTGIGSDNLTSGTLFQLMSALGDVEGYKPTKSHIAGAVRSSKPPKQFTLPAAITRDDSVAIEAAAYIESRGIDLPTAKLFQLQPVTRDGGPAIAFPYFRNGVHVHTKYRSRDGKKDPWKNFSADSGCKRVLYGADMIPATSTQLIITEGEFDAIAIKVLGMPAVSMPDGINSIDGWMDEEWTWLQRFKTIYLAVDMDVSPGDLSKLSIRLGKERCKRVVMPFKDANECLLMGWSSQDLQMALNGSEDMKPTHLKSSMDLADDFAKLKYTPEGAKEDLGTPWKIPGLSEYMKGKSLGRMTFWPGFNFAGKTTAMLQEMGDDLSEGVPCLFLCLEMRGVEAMEWLLRQQLRKPMEHISPRDFADSIEPGFLSNLWWVEPDERLKPEDMYECIRYAVLRYGVQQVYIDNLTCIGYRKDDYNAQAEFASTCKFKIARGLNVHVHIVAHTRKSKDMKSVSGDRTDIAGAKELSDLADNVLIIRRNEDEDAEKLAGQPTTTIRIDKNRFGGTQQTIDLTFNPVTGRFDPYTGTKAKKRNKRPGMYREYSQTREDY